MLFSLGKMHLQNKNLGIVIQQRDTAAYEAIVLTAQEYFAQPNDLVVF
jgi:hypothetical protein